MQQFCAFSRALPGASTSARAHATGTRSLRQTLGKQRRNGNSTHVATAAAGAERMSTQYVLPGGIIDYYELLGVDDDAATSEIKKAYRTLAKECHPDYLGDSGHNICILLNEAYETLMDEGARMKYNARLEQALQDGLDDYSGQPLSKWMPTANPKMAKNENPAENRAVFVDEFSCIGCRQCVWCASATFRLEPDHGRSRVFAQWLDPEDKIQAAIESCPVDCIHWVEKQDLPALEYVMQKKMTERVNVGIMMSGQGISLDVWGVTTKFLKDRKRKEEARAAAAKPYSAAQEEARRRAVEELQRQHLGFFAHFSSAFTTAFAGMGQMVGDAQLADFQQVGVRKRKAQSRWDWLEQQAAAGGWMVPPERALVPMSVYKDVEDY